MLKRLLQLTLLATFGLTVAACDALSQPAEPTHVYTLEARGEGDETVTREVLEHSAEVIV